MDNFTNMQNKTVLIALFIMLTAWTNSKAYAAPFCVVTSYTTNCWYYNLSSCQAAAAQSDGACVVGSGASRGGPVAVPISKGLDATGEMQQAEQFGQERRARQLDYQRQLLDLKQQIYEMNKQRALDKR